MLFVSWFISYLKKCHLSPFNAHQTNGVPIFIEAFDAVYKTGAIGLKEQRVIKFEINILDLNVHKLSMHILKENEITFSAFENAFSADANTTCVGREK